MVVVRRLRAVELVVGGEAGVQRRDLNAPPVTSTPSSDAGRQQDSNSAAVGFWAHSHAYRPPGAPPPAAPSAGWPLVSTSVKSIEMAGVLEKTSTRTPTARWWADDSGVGQEVAEQDADGRGVRRPSGTMARSPPLSAVQERGQSACCPRPRPRPASAAAHGGGRTVVPRRGRDGRSPAEARNARRARSPSCARARGSASPGCVGTTASKLIPAGRPSACRASRRSSAPCRSRSGPRTRGGSRRRRGGGRGRAGGRPRAGRA